MIFYTKQITVTIEPDEETLNSSVFNPVTSQYNFNPSTLGEGQSAPYLIGMEPTGEVIVGIGTGSVGGDA